MELFYHVVADVEPLKGDFSLGRLVSQQLAKADSICANMEEGFGRMSRAEWIRFLDDSRSSVRETRGCYRRMHHWLSDETIGQRIALLDEIIKILSATITTLKRSSLRSGPHPYQATPTSH